MAMKGQTKAELLDTYSADRVPVIRVMLRKTEGLTHAIGAESALFRSVFNHLTPWILSMEAVQLNSTEWINQLALNYHGSPLSVSDGHAGSLRAGDGVPDLAVALQCREGSAEPQPPQTTPIFNSLDPSMFTLLHANLADVAKTHAELETALGSRPYLMRGHQIGPVEQSSEKFRFALETS